MQLLPIEQAEPAQFQKWATEFLDKHNPLLRKGLAALVAKDYETAAKYINSYLSAYMDVGIAMGKRIEYLETIIKSHSAETDRAAQER